MPTDRSVHPYRTTTAHVTTTSAPPAGTTTASLPGTSTAASAAPGAHTSEADAPAGSAPVSDVEDEQGSPVPIQVDGQLAEVGTFSVVVQGLLLAVVLGSMFALGMLAANAQTEEAAPPHSRPQERRVPATAPQETAPALDAFLRDLEAGDVAGAHERLQSFVTGMQAGSTQAEAVQRYVSGRSQAFPGDYAFFLEEMLPAFATPDSPSAPESATQAVLDSSENILVSFGEGDSYSAEMVFNTQRSGSFRSGIDRETQTPHRLEITGGYTSSYDWPVGLTVNEGAVLNGALKRWDGLIIKDGQGSLHVESLDSLRYNFERYDLRSDLQDYKRFLQVAEEREWSVVQAHLIVGAGEVLAKPNGSTRRARRRVLFETEGGTVAVYDSFDERITLREVAATLRNEYGAQSAVNLDMGTYNHCAFYEGGRKMQDCSRVARGVVLSNVIAFDY
jgi:glutaredoxin-related protein